MRVHCKSIIITTTELPLGKVPAVSLQQERDLQQRIISLTGIIHDHNYEAHCIRIFVEWITNKPTTATTKISLENGQNQQRSYFLESAQGGPPTLDFGCSICSTYQHTTQGQLQRDRYYISRHQPKKKNSWRCI